MTNRRELLERLETHQALKESSPGFHLSEADIDTLIEALRNVEMTPAQAAEQRRSFAYGNCHIENENITREMVAEADERLHPKPR